MGIFDGKKFRLRTTSSWKFINALVVLWHYGLISVARMQWHLSTMLRKFNRIYDVQAEGRSFNTVPEMLKAMGGQDMLKLTQVSADDYLSRELGWSEKMVKELVTGALFTIYGQNTKVNAFAALASLVAMEGDSLWSVVGGNRLFAKKALEASTAILHEREVCAIRRARKGGKVLYTIVTKDRSTADHDGSPELPREFDAVIIANPLNTSTIKFEDFPTAVYAESATTPYQRTVVTLIQGELNPTFFGVDHKFDENFPQYILTTNLEDCAVDFSSLHLQIPAEVSASQGKVIRRRVCEGGEIPVWRLSSPKPLTEQQKQLVFRKIESERMVDWLAYPKYDPPEEFPPFILDDGVFYINGVEKAASAMEMSAIGAKNVALLAREYLAQQLD